MSRAVWGLRAPVDGDAEAVPTTILGPIVDLWRAQSTRFGSPWKFSCAGKPGDGGRFHLACSNGRGTSCWAASPVGAILEAVADPHATTPVPVTLTALTRLALWHTTELLGGGAVRVVDLTAPRSTLRLTGEINSTHDHALTQQWAMAFDEAGRAGVGYTARFANDHAVAFFDEEGVRPRPPGTLATLAIDHVDDLPGQLRATAAEIGPFTDLERAAPP